MSLADIPTYDEVCAERCRRSLRVFGETVWPHVPRLARVEFKKSWHVDAISQHLEAVVRGDIRFLLVNIGPRHGKSEWINILLPAWIWTRNPGYQMIFASLADKLAVRDSVRCREVVEQVPWYQRMFVPTVQNEEGEWVKAWSLRDDSNKKNDFSNTAGGRRLSVSVGGSVIGEGGDLIVGDDLQDPDSVASQTERENTNDFWSKSLSSRANNPNTVAKILVQQRLGDEDLSSRLAESGRYVHLNLPTEYDPRRSCVTVVAGKEFWRDPRTQPGELLAPDIFGPEAVAEAKDPTTGMGEAEFQVQHNQDPSAAKGGEFQRHMWRFYKPDGIGGELKHKRPRGCVSPEESPAVPLPAKLKKVLAVDTAAKDGQSNDWTVATVLGFDRANIYVLERVRVKVKFDGQVTTILDVCGRHPDMLTKLVEDKTNGTPILDHLRSEIPGLKAFVPIGSKEGRARVVLPRVSAGQVFLPDGAPWLTEWVEEFAAFPDGRHDDQIDTLSMAVIHEGPAKSSALQAARTLATW